jgi:hypothetical protein
VEKAAAQPRAGALLLASAGDTGWVADAARILRQFGFAVRTGAPVPGTGADIGLVMADTPPQSPPR